MDRKANLAPTIPIRPPPSAADTHHITSSSSSSSSSSPHSPPPNFLRQINAVFKRHRPLGTMQSNVSRASRVLVPPAVAPAPAARNITGKRPSRAAGAPVGAARMPKASLDPAQAVPPDDSSLTPPSVTGTLTTSPPFDAAAAPVADRGKDSLPPAPSSRLHMEGNADLAFQKGEGYPSNRTAVDASEPMHGEGVKLERRDELRQDQQYAATRSSAAGTICATTMSVHSGPTFQCTRAPASMTRMSSSAAEGAAAIRDNAPAEGRESALREGDRIQEHRQAPQSCEDIKERDASGNPSCSQSQIPSTNNIPPPEDSSRPGKPEKASRKKKYDPDLFFKVNGKLYQKLGKIGSGGSSEVHKVISSDCTIYALKKIKLKGRDYPTAHGFCQEIEYLNRLKGKKNIIQLIDYEVTDKTLLQGVMSGSTMSTKDGRIKDDQYIYMVLEYGEIDLAHMLSHKWKEMDSPGWEIDENWLRFYWQQMLEAVNTIHDERIVHSDLKPANFLLVRGSLKLIDFGIAKAIMSDTTNIQRDAQVGTLNYMSPEAFMWNEHDASGSTIKCGRSSDIWSLGCILYQMVYGKTPFAEYKTFWAKFKVITDRNHQIAYEPVSNPWLVDLMRRCLAWDHNERWRIPQLLRHPFLVPPMPKEPHIFEDHPCKFLMQKVGAHWNDPEVSRLCTELHEIVASLEKRKKDHDLHT